MALSLLRHSTEHPVVPRLSWDQNDLAWSYKKREDVEPRSCWWRCSSWVVRAYPGFLRCVNRIFSRRSSSSKRLATLLQLCIG